MRGAADIAKGQAGNWVLLSSSGNSAKLVDSSLTAVVG